MLTQISMSSSRTLRLVLILCALLILVWNIVRIITLSISEPDDLPSIQAQPSTISTQWSWFGDSNIRNLAATENSSSDELQDARVNAQLLGVVITNFERVASIATPSDPKGVFMEGDEIADGVSLAEIQSNRVLVREQGILRQLRMSVYSTEDQAVTRTQSQASRFALPAASSTEIEDQYDVRIVGTNEWGTAVKVDKIPDLARGSSALQPEDLIIRIAGNTIQALVRDTSLQESLMSSGALPLTVVRDDQPMEIVFNPAELPPEIRAMFGDN